MTPLLPRAARPLAAALLAAAAVAVAGCSDDHAAPVPPGAGGGLPGEGQVVEVDALDNRFEPVTLTVAAGTTVRFVNRGAVVHDVLPDEAVGSGGAPLPGGWGVGVDGFAPGAEYASRFDTPGTYGYYCSIHGVPGIGMAGTIVVTP